MDNYAEFENMTGKNINLCLDWDTGGKQTTEISPGEVAKVVFGSNSARICHRSDGGIYNTCPISSPIARAGDYFQLEENGGFRP